MLSSNNVKRISLLASSYSGSTIFGMLLAQDKRFCAFGDMYTIEGISTLDDLCNCGEKIKNCSLRIDLMRLLDQQGCAPEMVHSREYAMPFNWISRRFGGLRLVNAYRWLAKVGGDAVFYRSFRDREECFLKCLSSIQGYEYFVDGTKNVVRADILMRVVNDNLLVHLFRDPMSVVHSGVTRHDNKGRTIRAHLKSWCTYNRFAKELCESYPGRSCSISFDHLVKDPTTILEKLSLELGIAGLSVDPENVSAVGTHLIGNRARHKSKSINPNQMKVSVDTIRGMGVTQEEINTALSLYDNLLGNAT